MRILIIGGTVFLGRALVEAALAANHEVTLFNRGRSAPTAFPALQTIIGDRETDLNRLTGRSWDAAIDTCGYLPRLVQLSAAALRDAVEHYTFISTLSVYPPAGLPDRAETAELLTLADATVEEVTPETYGPLKALCERAVQAMFADRCLIIRSGLIAGPHDPTNRFTYWVTRAVRAGDAIAPPSEQPLQFIDVRDLAAFTVRQVEARAAGVYNVTGPALRLSFGDLLSAAKSALASEARFHHVTDAFLRAQDVGEFMGLPLWINHDLAASFMTFNIDRALAQGITFRPLQQTILDTRDWSRTLPRDAVKPADMPEAQEQALLRAWRQGMQSD